MSIEIRRLYIIGAGASRSNPYDLPTLKTLLWDLYEYINEEDKSILKKAIYESCGTTLERPEDGPDFEVFLSRLDIESLWYLPNQSKTVRQTAEDIALRSLREFMLHKCQIAQNKTGPYDRLVQSLNDEQAIVSFNWDVLLEVAFRKFSRQYTYLEREAKKDVTLLLRPHGCISWYPLLEREIVSVNTSGNIGVIGGLNEYYMCYLKDPLGVLDSANVSPDWALSQRCAIILPTTGHVLAVGGIPHDEWIIEGHKKLIKDTWRTFGELVANANEIVVIGYSLPGTDAATIEIMRTFGKKSKKRLCIIDKDEKVIERYGKIVFDGVEHVCNDFSAFGPNIL